MDSEHFYNTLFESGEHTNFVSVINDKATGAMSLDSRTKFHRFFSINALIKGKSRKDIHVHSYRNFLFEMDKVPLEEQIPIFKAAKFPFSTIVFSGGKSYHFILSLETPLPERVQYDAIWKACASVLKKFGGEADTATKNPTRLSRCPGVMRENGNEQTLKAVTKRIPNATLFEWLESHGVNWQDFIPKIKSDPNTIVSDVEDKLKLEWVLNYKMGSLVYKEKNKNNYQFVLARHLKNTGLDKSTVFDLVRSHCGEIKDNGAPIDSAFSPGYDNDEKIYVPSKKERAEYYKKVERVEAEDIAKKHKQDLMEKKIAAFDVNKRPPILPEIEVQPGEGIHRYITVGTDYFKIDVEENRLIPWNATMFEKIYGKGVLPPKCYDAFGYSPDYLSPLHQVLDLGSRGQYRNHFQKPLWVAAPGDWGDIKTVLQGAFKAQFDLILKYCAVSLIWPKQPLPIIVFVGEENTGKSGVIKIFQMLLGEKNCKTIKSKQFESDFEGHLQYVQLVVIEEAGNWKDPHTVAAEFKRLATERGNIWVNPKFGRQIEVPFYGKFMLTSNDISPVKLEGAATRFWIIEMSELKNEITNYFNKIKDQLGAFAHYLLTEIAPTLPHPDTKTERMYFSPDEFWTPAKDFMKEFSKSDLYFELQEIFEEFFTTYEDQDECWFDLSSLKSKMKEEAKDKAIKAILKKEWGIDTRTEVALRPDSLKFYHKVAVDVFNIPEFPKRKARWFCLERSKFNKKG